MKDTEDCIPMEVSSSGKLRCDLLVLMIWQSIHTWENDIEECKIHKIDQEKYFNLHYTIKAITYTITVEHIPIAMLGVCDSNLKKIVVCLDAWYTWYW